jgi:hypothetical protein
MKKVLVILFFVLPGLSGCSLFSDVESKAQYPVNQEMRRRQRLGKITGDEGLIVFGKTADERNVSGTSGIGINSYLWRATLDVLSFMPLASADPFGGVIVTDWHQDPDAPKERFKMNVLILDQKLRSNALKVTVFKQNYVGNRSWQDAKVSPTVAREIEDKVLTRARELRTQD